MSESNKGVFKQFKGKLPKLLSFDQYAPKPSMINESQCLISISPDTIYKYDLITKKLTKIHTTPSFILEEHTNFFYAPRNDFYLFDATRLLQFRIDFTKNTAHQTYETPISRKNFERHHTKYRGLNSQVYSKNYNYPYYDSFPCGLISNICTDKICYMAGIITQWKYNFAQDQLIFKLSPNCFDKYEIQHPRFIQVNQNKFLAIGSSKYLGQSDNGGNILIGHAANDGTDIIWELSEEYKIPYTQYESSQYDAVLAFNEYVFLFCFPTRKILVLDMKKNKWYVSHIKLPFVNYGHSITYTYLQNYIIHILKFPDGDHFTVDIFNLIPKKMKKYYDKINEKLVIGYCRQQTYSIPFVLKKLISLYYPSFI